MRIYLRELKKYDAKNDTSLVRELEMVVDASLRDAGYAIQFWRDMEVYGLKEAVTYLRGSGCVGNMADVDQKMKEIIAKITDDHEPCIAKGIAH